MSGICLKKENVLVPRCHSLLYHFYHMYINSTRLALEPEHDDGPVSFLSARRDVPVEPLAVTLSVVHSLLLKFFIHKAARTGGPHPRIHQTLIRYIAGIISRLFHLTIHAVLILSGQRVVHVDPIFNKCKHEDPLK